MSDRGLGSEKERDTPPMQDIVHNYDTLAEAHIPAVAYHNHDHNRDHTHVRDSRSFRLVCASPSSPLGVRRGLSHRDQR